MSTIILLDIADTARIAAPRSRVWSVIADIDRYPDRLHSHLTGNGDIRAVRLTGPVRTGVWFEADVTTAALGSFTSRHRIQDATKPQRLAWISYPPRGQGETEDHQIEVHWSFDLTPTADGTTDLRHRLRLPAPALGAEELATFLQVSGRIAAISSGIGETLQTMKLFAEQPW